MKYLKSKKAQLFNLGLVGIATLALIIALILFKPYEGKEQFQVGPKQFQMFNSFQESEKHLFYIDQAAKLSAQQAIYDLTSNAGFYTSRCGTYQNYGLWNENCYPDYELNLKIYLTQNLNPYLTELDNLLPETRVFSNNYEISLIQKDSLNVIGTAVQPIKSIISRADQPQNLAGRYHIYPSFSVQTDYDLERFPILINQAFDLIDLCQDKTDNDLEDCILDNIPDGWEPGPCRKPVVIQNRKCSFCYYTGKQILTYNNTSDKIEFRPIAYKFALDFS
ncbi:hypothetical protein GF361_03885 [Candidatus Woesearchaeota archaeon]|nr:hypothetical protein [Candidatus Woesearchaeota archaeon]